MSEPLPQDWMKAQIELIKSAMVDYSMHTAQPSMLIGDEQMNESQKTLNQMGQMLTAIQSNHSLRSDAYGVEDAFREMSERLRQIEDRSGPLEEKLQSVTERLDLLTEAIAISHMKDEEDQCIKGCWACHIIDVMKGLKAARKLMGETS